MAVGSVATKYVENHESFAGAAIAEKVYFEQLHTTTVVDQQEFERLKHQATRLEHLLQVMPAGVVVIDGKGVVKQSNALAKNLLGEPLEGQIWRTIINRSFKPQADDGHEVSLRDGRKVKLSITPLLEEPGQLIVMTDLTETRQLQQRISHMQRLSALGKTVASLVHQIRTPLSAAILYAANLSNKSLSEENKDKFADKLQTRLGELESQVNDMLLFAKSGEKQVIEKIAVSDLFKEISAGSDAMLQKHHAWLEIELKSENMTIMGNMPALVGAVQNLIHNALQAKPEGASLRLTAHQQDDNINIVVEDDGPGIDNDVLTNIFEPFFTTQSHGTGLGLAVVKSVAKSHHGDVFVSNVKHGGAKFTVALPCISDTSEANSTGDHQ